MKTGDQEEDPIEEDWSGQIRSSNIGGFANHTEKAIVLPDGQTLQMKCIDSLAPIDMIFLSAGKFDVTGNRIWLGAEFFVSALNEFDWSLFTGKRILELGCGTGFSGIALMKLACKNKMPECLVLSDVDEGSLSLCRQNCEQNLSACKERIKIQHLSWGDCADVEECFDTIIATDVIYDVSAIRPLFSTVKRYLAPFGYFILSHVPRASLSDDSCKIAPQDKMEKFIEREANSHGLNLNEVVRPENIAFSHQEITRMKEAGAAIMVFRTEEPAETAIFP